MKLLKIYQSAALTLRQEIDVTLAQAKGTRWDVVASRTVGVVGALAGIAPYAHFIPGKTGAAIAGTAAVAAAVLPRATKAAGLLATAYGHKTPLLKVVPQLLSTLFSSPAIIAEAKAKEKAAEQQQLVDQLADQQKLNYAQIADQQKLNYAQIVNDTIDELQRRLQTGSFAKGELSEDVPEALKAVFSTLEKQTVPAPSVPALTSTITVADKAPASA